MLLRGRPIQSGAGDSPPGLERLPGGFAVGCLRARTVTAQTIVGRNLVLSGPKADVAFTSSGPHGRRHCKGAGSRSTGLWVRTGLPREPLAGKLGRRSAVPAVVAGSLQWVRGTHRWTGAYVIDHRTGLYAPSTPVKLKALVSSRTLSRGKLRPTDRGGSAVSLSSATGEGDWVYRKNHG